MDIIKMIIPSIHREGIAFVILSLIIAVIASFISPIITVICLCLTIFIIYFFRDPTRFTVVGKNFISSPADGLITDITSANMPKDLGGESLGKYTKISIFLSVFDVHVNRVPADGKILVTHYHKGQFINASLDKSSDVNERQEILMEADAGIKIAFVQIAGLIARRIVCNLKKGDEVQGGKRFGIIRFGSRMDVYIPQTVKPLVTVGQYVRGGETILADMNESKIRKFVTR